MMSMRERCLIQAKIIAHDKIHDICCILRKNINGILTENNVMHFKLLKFNFSLQPMGINKWQGLGWSLLPAANFAEECQNRNMNSINIKEPGFNVAAPRGHQFVEDIVRRKNMTVPQWGLPNSSGFTTNAHEFHSTRKYFGHLSIITTMIYKSRKTLSNAKLQLQGSSLL